jgi:3-ketosteroid 9alpha-monooxygenase subunit B
MTAVRAALSELGFERGRVHIERFKSLGANPFEQAVVEESTARTASVTVTLDGVTSSYEWPADTKLLDLLLARGLDAPYSCREGACSACACRLVAGEVKMLNNDVLDEEDLADGIRLACQSLPVTDEVEISYE